VPEKGEERSTGRAWYLSVEVPGKKKGKRRGGDDHDDKEKRSKSPHITQEEGKSGLRSRRKARGYCPSPRKEEGEGLTYMEGDSQKERKKSATAAQEKKENQPRGKKKEMGRANFQGGHVPTGFVWLIVLPSHPEEVNSPSTFLWRGGGGGEFDYIKFSTKLTATKGKRVFKERIHPALARGRGEDGGVFGLRFRENMKGRGKFCGDRRVRRVGVFYRVPGEMGREG